MRTPSNATPAPDQIQTEGESAGVSAPRLTHPIHRGTTPIPVTKPHADRPGSSRLASATAPTVVMTAMTQP